MAEHKFLSNNTLSAPFEQRRIQMLSVVCPTATVPELTLDEIQYAIDAHEEKFSREAINIFMMRAQIATRRDKVD